MLSPFADKTIVHHQMALRGNALIAFLVSLLVAIVWGWWPSLVTMVERWNADPQYSHGFLVPILAFAIVYVRWQENRPGDCRPQTFGLVIVATGAVLATFGALIYFDWLQTASLLLVLHGITMLVGGRWLAAITWPGTAFLLFMIPMPYAVEVSLAQPLQSFAASASTTCLQLLGYTALQRGNTIALRDMAMGTEALLGVEEACSGLRMLVVFFAIATSIALLLQRSWLHRWLIVLSAAPIALICNIVRITATGAMHQSVSPEFADQVFHDYAGWLMMPSAVLLMFCLLKWLDWVIDDQGSQPGTGQSVPGVLLPET